MYFTLVVVDGSRTIALEENRSPNPRTNPNPGAIFVTVPHYVFIYGTGTRVVQRASRRLAGMFC